MVEGLEARDDCIYHLASLSLLSRPASEVPHHVTLYPRIIYSCLTFAYHIDLFAVKTCF